jgi:rRNA maturation endonuclease Nob1
LSDQNQSTLVCIGCGRQVPEGLRFCPYCGRPGPSGASMNDQSVQQKRTCPGCGREALEGLAFCPYCGRPGPSVPIPNRTEAASMNAPSAPPLSQTSSAGLKVACNSCGKNVPDGLNFCPMCGKPAPYAQGPAMETKDAAPKMHKCVGCGRDAPTGLNFCPYCGRPDATRNVPASTISQTPAASQTNVETANNKIRCNSCGREFPANLNFCPYCGRVNNSASAPKIAPLVPIIKQETAPQTPNDRQLTTRPCMGCGKQIPEGLKFCPYCGRIGPNSTMQSEAIKPSVSETRVCLGCGMEISNASKFCPECGRPREQK